MRQHVISTLALGTKTNCQEPLGRGLPWYLAVLQAIALLSFPDSLKFRGPSSLEEPSFGGFFFLGSFCSTCRGTVFFARGAGAAYSAWLPGVLRWEPLGWDGLDPYGRSE